MIDCHAHLGLYFELGTDGTPNHFYDFNPSKLIGMMDRAGVDKAIAFPMAPNIQFEPGQVPKVDDAFKDTDLKPSTYIIEMSVILGAAKRTGRIIPFIPVYIRDENYSMYVEGMAEEYDVAGLKLHGPGTGSPISEYSSSRMMDLARDRSLPVMVHTDRYELGNMEGKKSWELFGNPLELVDMAKKNPNIRFCGAHLGAFSKAFLDSVRNLRNLWTDCSPLDLLCQMEDYHAADSLISDYSNPSRVLEKIYEYVPDRLLWGTDAPYYRKTKSSYSNQVSILRSLGDDAVSRISDQNAREFLGIG